MDHRHRGFEVGVVEVKIVTAYLIWSEHSLVDDRLGREAADVELVKELSNVLKQQYESMFEKFELESAELTKLNNMDVLSVKGHYNVLNYSIGMEQVLVPSKSDSIVLTCTYDTAKAKADDVIKACRSAVESLVLAN